MNQNERLIHCIWDTGHKMRHLHDAKLSQSRILIVLLEKGRMTQRDLTHHLHIKPGSASEILSKIERNGLIVRTVNSDDSRIMDVSLTEEGIAKANEALKKRKDIYDRMFVCFNDDEKEELIKLLDKMLKSWDEEFDLKDGKHHSREGRE